MEKSRRKLTKFLRFKMPVMRMPELERIVRRNYGFKNDRKFINRQKVSFITSVDNDGFPNIKAMLKPRKHIGLKEFYFSTNTSSMRVKNYQNNPNASIYFYHKGLIKYEGIMLIGKMEVLTDQKTKSEIWRPGDKLFYKKGVTDPDYCVLKFTANHYCPR